MTVPLYFDHNVSPAAATGLQHRDVDVLTARQDGREGEDDELLLQQATELGRVLYTRDRDFLAIANRWRASNRPFSGIVYSRHRRLSIGQIIADLEVIAKASDPEDWLSRTEYLPL